MKIGIIGLGYVGLPLFCSLCSHFKVFGVDISKDKIKNLNSNFDYTLELDKDDLKILRENVKNISYEYEILHDCDVYIITVPTPIDCDKRPNLRALENSVSSLAKFIKQGNLIILESTVYPGATYKYIGKYIEENTQLKLNKDFGIGFSPERINPGDKLHTLKNTIKIISASSEYYLNKMDLIYSKIISAGIYKTSSIEVAEATKIMENVQRDVNIAFMNEFEEILKAMNIDIWEVIEAAKTKWNFLSFTPGLVGGHCIGIDPYYLIYKSENNGINPHLIRTAREINERTVSIKALSLLKQFTYKKNKKLLLLGITFKPDCPDIRNSKVIDMINLLEEFDLDIKIFDPYIKPERLPKLKLLKNIDEINSNFDLICLTVEHKYFFSKTWENHIIKKDIKDKIIYLRDL